jgi:hypothetical protein
MSAANIRRAMLSLIERRRLIYLHLYSFLFVVTTADHQHRSRQEEHAQADNFRSQL